MVSVRTLALGLVLLAALSACRDEGLVGEGSACANTCDVDERCVNGVCVPRDDGAAGETSEPEDDSEHHDEDEHHEEEESEDDSSDS